MNKAQKLWLLFKTTFISSTTANSGYAILSVMKNLFVEKYKWFNEDEMNDYIGLAQSAPGPMAVNGAVIIGYQINGIFGSIVAVMGIVIPPIIIMILVTVFYQYIVSNEYVRLFMEGMEAGVCALLLDVIIGLFVNVTKDKSIYPYILIIISFIYIKFTHFSIFYLALACVVAGVVKSLLTTRKVRK